MRLRLPFLSAALLIPALPAPARRSMSPLKDTPAPVAATRPELKEQLERSKQSHPRLPLPPPTEQELAEAKARAGRGPMGGIINNGRMRKLYLPRRGARRRLLREPDPTMTVDNTFKTMFFWIVSRANNCTYCQGHQEVKLSGDGVKEETIAALDGDWSEFTPAERAAFAFTLKLTAEPNRISDADIDRLRSHYNDLQILEIITAVGGFNAMNRWTGPLAIPQEGHRVYLTPTPEKYKAMRSLVAPLPADTGASAPACARPADRGAMEIPGPGRGGPRGMPQAFAPSAAGIGGAGARGRAGRLVRLGSAPRVGPPPGQLPQGGQGMGRPDVSLRDQGTPQPEAQGRDRLRRGPQ